MHVAQRVWAIQNFEEVLTCNIRQCKNGCYRGRNKESKIFVMEIKLHIILGSFSNKALYLIRPFQFNQISSPLLY